MLPGAALRNRAAAATWLPSWQFKKLSWLLNFRTLQKEILNNIHISKDAHKVPSTSCLLFRVKLPEKNHLLHLFTCGRLVCKVWWDKVFFKRQVLHHSAICLMESRVYSCARVLKKKFQPWFFEGKKLTIFSYWSPSFPESHKSQTVLHSTILKFFPFLPVIRKVACSVQWPW